MSGLTIHAGRRSVAVARPDKPLFPDDTTKADLARYYETVAPAMLPHLAARPLNLERYPDGIDGQRFMQQRIPRNAPDWLGRTTVPKARGTVEHVVANEPAALVWLADQACITPHRWLSRSDRLDDPDLLVIDLDPSDDDAPAVRRAALALGDLIRELGLEPAAMTTGSRGYHVAVPLQRRQGHDAVRAFARDLAKLAVARDPEHLTLEQRKAKRGDRILLDVMRNAYAHTAVAPYAVRARPGAPVATPLRWEELHDRRMHPQRWTLRNLPRRLDRLGRDPWQELPPPAALGKPRAHLDQLLHDARGAAEARPAPRQRSAKHPRGSAKQESGAAARPDRLSPYRAKRNAARTPEPSGTGPSAGGRRAKHPIFVVQQHAARALHYDLRLEVDGVLRSWAVPKGPSLNPREKRLAMAVEDHPLDYGDFEGTIPAGEYGAGAVIVWDTGPYRNLTERDGKPVPIADALAAGHAVVELQGEKLRGGFALTRVATEPRERWILVKTRDAAADTRRNVVVSEPASVLSGRTVQQVAGR